jgi:hypothetical protein
VEPGTLRRERVGQVEPGTLKRESATSGARYIKDRVGRVEPGILRRERECNEWSQEHWGEREWDE